VESSKVPRIVSSEEDDPNDGKEVKDDEHNEGDESNRGETLDE